MAELIKLDGYEHDPMDCAINMEHNMRYQTTLGQVTQLMSNMGMTYFDFCNMTIDLDHYYHNWAEICDEDLDDPEFACNAVLPSMFESWGFGDFLDDD